MVVNTLGARSHEADGSFDCGVERDDAPDGKLVDSPLKGYS